jgi:hypothetical protein
MCGIIASDMRLVVKLHDVDNRCMEFNVVTIGTVTKHSDHIQFTDSKHHNSLSECLRKFLVQK